MSTRRTWIEEHIADPYVKQAQNDGYPARSAYKLLEIHHKDRLLQPGFRVVDLGAAPGGWSMVARDLVGPAGKVYALDLLPLDAPITGVDFIQGDFNEQAALDALLHCLGNEPVDLVMSD